MEKLKRDVSTTKTYGQIHMPECLHQGCEILGLCSANAHGKLLALDRRNHMTMISVILSFLFSWHMTKVSASPPRTVRLPELQKYPTAKYVGQYLHRFHICSDPPI